MQAYYSRLVSDLLCRPDYIPHRYSLELRRMINELNLTHLYAVCPFELIDPDSGLSEANMSEEEYVSRIPEVRACFKAHEIPGFDIEEALIQDVGTLRTYLGYVKFLEAELAGQPCVEMDNGKKASGMKQKKARKQISKNMLIDGAVSSSLYLCFRAALNYLSEILGHRQQEVSSCCQA